MLSRIVSALDFSSREEERDSRSENGYSLVTGRNSFTYEGFYDASAAREKLKKGAKGELFLVQRDSAGSGRGATSVDVPADAYLGDIINDVACNFI